jgi:hypothetical protein
MEVCCGKGLADQQYHHNQSFFGAAPAARMQQTALAPLWLWNNISNMAWVCLIGLSYDACLIFRRVGLPSAMHDA